jgi:histidinol-phosphatase
VATDLELAFSLLDVADAITLGRFLSADLRVDTKPDLTPVTEADRGVEQAIRARLAQERPDDAILGEEYGEAAPEPGARRWIVDPIDATKNYVRGIPIWGTLLALQDGEEIVAGAVSAPALRRRWWAVRGQGAWVDDGLALGLQRRPRRIAVSKIGALGDAQLSFSGLEGWADGAARLRALAASCWRSRGLGDFWAYMLLAEGAVDIACEPEVELWDLAAPKVIVEEAGGRLTDLSGVATAAGGDALATNGALHEAALELIGR